jgi:hypothetical protein
MAFCLIGLEWATDADLALAEIRLLISHIFSLKLFCKSQFPHKFVNFFFILGQVDDFVGELTF